jgi:hypothetical protein
VTWAPGDVVVERRFHGGRLRWVLPQRVVASEPELHALYVAPGTTLLRAHDPDGRVYRGEGADWQLGPVAWTGRRVLVLLRPGRAHALWLWWDAGDGRFGGWYVNLQSPFRADELGYVTEDHALDIVVDPDGAWRWKDEDELADAVRAGRVHEAAARAEGERVLAERPWPTGWEGFRPDPSWPVPELPPAADLGRADG